MQTRKLAISFLLGAAASVASAQSFLQQYGEVVQGSNEAVPGLPGVTIAASAATSIPIMDLDGNILWRGKLAGTGVVANSNDQALFYGRTRNNFQMILRRGDAEPSGTLPGATVVYATTTWDVPRLSPQNGFMMFGTTLAGTGITTSNDSCIYWGVPGNLQILAREGGLAPSGGAAYTANFTASQQLTCLNSSGTAAIKAKLIGGDVGAPNGGSSTWGDDCIITGTPGSLLIAARDGDYVVDAVTSTVPVIDNVAGFNMVMDESGRILFEQALSTTMGVNVATTANDTGLVLYTPGGGLTLVAREGWDVPGSSGTLQYAEFSQSAFSRQSLSRSGGWIQFTDNVTGSGAVGTSDTCIFAGTISGGVTMVARELTPAPTGVPGEVYQALFPSGQPAIGNDGTVIFVAQLGPAASMTTFNDVAVFRAVPPYGPSDVTMIAREGQVVAGTPGWVIGNTSGGGMSSSSTKLAVNDQGTVLISVAGVGDNTLANWGLPAVVSWDPLHPNVVRSVYQQGDTFTVNGNPWVTTSAPGAGWISTNGSGTSDGCDLSFNNNGDVCFKLFAGSENAVVRGHVGSMFASPASIDSGAGGTQNFVIDAGPSHPFEFYVVLGSVSGTRPGVVTPLGPHVIPLNFDFWTQLSLDLSNSPIYANSIWFTDANGVNMAPASFHVPPSVPGLQGLFIHHAAVLLNGSLNTTGVTEPTAVSIY